DPQQILAAYTPDVHGLYLNVAARAELKLEVLPIEFFQQLALRAHGEVELLTLAIARRIVALAWCLQAGPDYHVLYGGLDYQLNDDYELYFNLSLASLDHALRKRPARIYFGQTADAFKVRL